METVILQGVVQHGKGKGHLAGFPTANLRSDSSVLPTHGVYASILVTSDREMRSGVTNVGTRPTADHSDQITVETWLPGYQGNLYGQRVTVLLLSYLRGIREFRDMTELKSQIDQDARRGAEISEAYAASCAVSGSAEATRDFGACVSDHLRIGDVLTLSGPLGAGKSEFARGIARGLGIDGPLPSPTFTILNVYNTEKTALYHYDWYRIEDPEELIAIGAEEHLPGDGVTLVEWAEQAPELLPEERLEIRIIPINEQTRIIHLEPKGGFRPVDQWLTERKERC